MASSLQRAIRAPDTARREHAALSLPRRFASLVKLEHTVFALPFAYVGAFLAVDGFPGVGPTVWLTLAMVGARTLAMGLESAHRRGARRSKPAHGDP